VRLVFFPASDGELIDTWATGGMRGTGSHDYAIKELFIPAERVLAMDAPARLDAPLYRRHVCCSSLLYGGTYNHTLYA
jgi:alkylation response protein AidB-like acyl-CoA dehydrogenase